MTDLDRLILALDTLHESLHRIYQALGVRPACQQESEHPTDGRSASDWEERA